MTLYALAAAVGLQVYWEDATGRPQRVDDAALVAILAVLGHPAGTDAEIADSVDALGQMPEHHDFVSGDIGHPIATGLSPGKALLVLEEGMRITVEIDAAGCLPGISAAGYHQLEVGHRRITLAVAPLRCFGFDDVLPGRRGWAPAVQIAGVRGSRSTTFGDFGALVDTARSAAACGAQALAISPTHALFPSDPSRYSPYSPSSRSFLNVLYGDPRLIRASVDEGDSTDLIDWATAIPARISALRRAFAEAGSGVRDAVAAFRQARGAALEQHARFDALHAHFFAATGAHGWQAWPAAFHDPAGAAVAAFVADHGEEVAFHAFLQWLADLSLEQAHATARANGMAIGLIADLAVGMDAGGSHAWSRRDDLLMGLSIGAPPDVLGPQGQNWGITALSPTALRRTGFAPFIATLRTALAHAGGIRIDHALGLKRLWVMPEGAPADQGAYLAMPFDDLMRIVAIESWRARAIVVGEDLGTIPDGFRDTMEARGLFGMRVLPFERAHDGGFIAPRHWSPHAVAMTGTHDTPTVAGWWSGRDIDWTWMLGRAADGADEATDRATRAQDRGRLWSAMAAAGVAPGPEPEGDDPKPAVDAAVAFVGATSAPLAILPIEDLVGLVEQPNVPGTIHEHPNWRRRMPDTTEALFARPEVAARLAALNAMRAR